MLYSADHGVTSMYTTDPGRWLIAALVLLACGPIAAAPPTSERDIRAVLAMQQAAWNRGDVEAFMAGYDESATTTFVGATITHGFEQVLESYHRRYPSREKMGQLAFSELEIRLLGADYASVVGKWHLARTAEAGGEVGGIFTLLFQKTAGGWKIILDHTS